MISEKMYVLGSKQSCIREIFEFGLKRKQQVGEENVFDYSLGNPSIPTHKQVDNTITGLIQEGNSLMLHGYTPAGGDKRAREAIAEDLNERYGMNISSNNLLLTCGAAAAVGGAHALAETVNLFPLPNFGLKSHLHSVQYLFLAYLQGNIAICPTHAQSHFQPYQTSSEF